MKRTTLFDRSTNALLNVACIPTVFAVEYLDFSGT